MESANLLLDGIKLVLSPTYFIYVFVGVFGGMIFGCIPGLTGSMGLTIALPFTFFIESKIALVFLTAIFIGAISGGYISAILLNMPGTPSAVATTFDGYPMSQKGEAEKALGIAVFSSGIGGILGTVVLILASPVLARQALKFGPFEYFSLGLLTFLAISVFLGGNMLKNLMSLSLGIIIACIGSDPITGVPRLTFGVNGLVGGFALLPFIVGLFCVPQIIESIYSSSDLIIPESANKVSIKSILQSITCFKNQTINVFRASIVGILTGILPGVGAATANVLSYQIAKTYSKNSGKYGTGIADGIIASEVSNNACVPGAYIPTLALGIPGSSDTAILLGAMMIHGIQPGPLVFRRYPDLVYAVFSAHIIGIIIMVLLGVFLIRYFIRILSFPKKYILPVILLFCIIGAFGTNNRIFDIWVLLIFSIIGILFKKYNLPLVPILIAYVLQPVVEKGLREGLAISNGSILPIFTRPISLFLVILGFLTLGIGIYLNRKTTNMKS